MEKLVIVAISLILLIFLMDHKHVMVRFLYINILVISIENALSEDGTTNYHIGLKRCHIVRTLRNGQRIKRVGLTEFA